MWMCSFQCQSGITPYCTKQCSGLRMSTCCLPVRTHLVKACGYHKQHLHLTTLGLTIKHQERTTNTNLTSLQEFMTLQVWVFTLETFAGVESHCLTFQSYHSYTHFTWLNWLSSVLFDLHTSILLSMASFELPRCRSNQHLSPHVGPCCPSSNAMCFKEWGNEPAWQSGHLRATWMKQLNFS